MRLCGECQIVFVDEMYGEDENIKHRCCGGSVHIKQAAVFVAVSALALSCLNGVLMCFGIYSINLTFDLIMLTINTVAGLLIFYGLYYEKQAYLIPFLVTQIAQCALFFILALCTVYFLIVQKKQNPIQRFGNEFYPEIQQPTSLILVIHFNQIVMIISIAIGIVISGWAVWVITKCYHYLRNHDQESETDSYHKHHSFWR
uniref:7TM GPCR serpentine receptor class x (Srx) domain-containing protein n=1 Tax=Syphacia muris TaxID=451379 RepID=A0A0N5AFF7_9BILA